LIVADSGGSNAARCLVFKIPLHRLALEIGPRTTVANLPPGTSKWNKVAHRLFARIRSNWRGRPLTSLDVVVRVVSSSLADQAPGLGLRVEDGVVDTAA
jgi:hypothetical protein